MAAFRVLVVDDNHEVRRMVTASIKTLGSEIDVLDVPSAEEALFISTSLPLDLIVLDFRLPGMSGLEMVTRLRKRKPETKIILVTGIEDADTRQQVSQADVAAHFFKPIEINVFLDAVRRCLWPELIGADLPTVEAGLPAPIPATRSSESESPGVNVAKPALQRGFQPTLGERLTALKQQVRAIAALLVHATGEVHEGTGDMAEITADPALLPALLQAFKDILKVKDALGKSSTESMLYLTSARKRIYLAPVDPSYALLVVMKGYFEPDRLGILDRAIHLAVQDLQAILEKMQEQASLISDNLQAGQIGLPAEIILDPETLARVEDMFSQASKENGKQEADGFWETLGENGDLGGVSGKDVLSYDQARDMGLAPEDGAIP